MVFHIIYCCFFAFLPLLCQPPKLLNCGATCYLNAATQALLAINPLKNFLQLNPNVYARGSFENSFQQLITAAPPLGLPNRQLMNTYAKQGANIIAGLSQGNPLGQQDASEFLGEVLDRLRTKGREDKEKTIRQFLSNIMGILIYSQIECPLSESQSYIASKHTSTTYYLSLPVKTAYELRSLEECLYEYFQPEQIEFNDQECRKTSQLEHISSIFMVSLSRYIFDIETLEAKKLSHSIHVPLTFDVQPYLIQKQNHNLYKLIACVVHHGTAAGGHYVACVKYDNQWYLCDDTTITKITKKKVKQYASMGYIYIYEQESYTTIKKQLAHLKRRLKRLLSQLR